MLTNTEISYCCSSTCNKDIDLTGKVVSIELIALIVKFSEQKTGARCRIKKRSDYLHISKLTL